LAKTGDKPRGSGGEVDPREGAPRDKSKAAREAVSSARDEPGREQPETSEPEASGIKSNIAGGRRCYVCNTGHANDSYFCGLPCEELRAAFRKKVAEETLRRTASALEKDYKAISDTRSEVTEMMNKDFQAAADAMTAEIEEDPVCPHCERQFFYLRRTTSGWVCQECFLRPHGPSQGSDVIIPELTMAPNLNLDQVGYWYRTGKGWSRGRGSSRWHEASRGEPSQQEEQRWCEVCEQPCMKGDRFCTPECEEKKRKADAEDETAREMEENSTCGRCLNRSYDIKRTASGRVCQECLSKAPETSEEVGATDSRPWTPVIPQLETLADEPQAAGSEPPIGEPEPEASAPASPKIQVLGWRNEWIPQKVQASTAAARAQAHVNAVRAEAVEASPGGAPGSSGDQFQKGKSQGKSGPVGRAQAAGYPRRTLEDEPATGQQDKDTVYDVCRECKRDFIILLYEVCQECEARGHRASPPLWPVDCVHCKERVCPECTGAGPAPRVETLGRGPSGRAAGNPEGPPEDDPLYDWCMECNTEFVVEDMNSEAGVCPKCWRGPRSPGGRLPHQSEEMAGESPPRPRKKLSATAPQMPAGPPLGIATMALRGEVIRVMHERVGRVHMGHLVFHGDGSVEKVVKQRSTAAQEEPTFARWHPAVEATPSWRLPPRAGEPKSPGEEEEIALERTLATMVVQRTQGIPASSLRPSGHAGGHSEDDVTEMEEDEPEGDVEMDMTRGPCPSPTAGERISPETKKGSTDATEG